MIASVGGGKATSAVHQTPDNGLSLLSGGHERELHVRGRKSNSTHQWRKPSDRGRGSANDPPHEGNVYHDRTEQGGDSL
jgi:hypothetical protein